MRRQAGINTVVRNTRQVIVSDVAPESRVGHVPADEKKSGGGTMSDASVHYFTIGVDDLNHSSNGKWVLG